jgi:hypothetical protein
MKITISKLKQLIKEELAKEGFGEGNPPSTNKAWYKKRNIVLEEEGSADPRLSELVRELDRLHHGGVAKKRARLRGKSVWAELVNAINGRPRAGWSREITPEEIYAIKFPRITPGSVEIDTAALERGEKAHKGGAPHGKSFYEGQLVGLTKKISDWVDKNFYGAEKDEFILINNYFAAMGWLPHSEEVKDFPYTLNRAIKKYEAPIKADVDVRRKHKRSLPPLAKRERTTEKPFEKPWSH